MYLIKSLFVIMTLTFMLSDLSAARSKDESYFENKKKRMVTLPVMLTLKSINNINLRKKKMLSVSVC